MPVVKLKAKATELFKKHCGDHHLAEAVVDLVLLEVKSALIQHSLIDPKKLDTKLGDLEYNG